jgi:hypothetical protein
MVQTYIVIHIFLSGETSLLTLEASLTMPVADVEFEISETSFGKVGFLLMN